MELNELRKIAEAATPGPWKAETHCAYTEDKYHAVYSVDAGDSPVISQLGCGCCDVGLEVSKPDAAFVTAFNPEAVLALLSRLEQAEQDRVKLRNRLDAMRRQRDGYRNQLRKTEPTKEKTMPNTPLSPDAILEAARASRHALHDEDFWGFSSESDAQDYGFEEGAKWAQKQLAVAQPVVNSVEELAKAWYVGFCKGEQTAFRERPVNPDTINPYKNGENQ